MKEDKRHVYSYKCPPVGSLVIVRVEPDREERWHRGRVTRLIEKEPEADGDAPAGFQVFLVDWGVSEVVSSGDSVPLSDRFLQRLPFQAVECGLAHVRPVALAEFRGSEPGLAEDFGTADDSTWDDESAGDQLFEWSRIPSTDMPAGKKKLSTRAAMKL